MTKAFRERHDYVISALNDIEGVECATGDGTFYAFPNVAGAIDCREGTGKDDTALSEMLLNEAEVVAGTRLGFRRPGYIRLSFAPGLDTLQEAISKHRPGTGLKPLSHNVTPVH